MSISINSNVFALLSINTFIKSISLLCDVINNVFSLLMTDTTCSVLSSLKTIDRSLHCLIRNVSTFVDRIRSCLVLFVIRIKSNDLICGPNDAENSSINESFMKKLNQTFSDVNGCEYLTIDFIQY